jgi:ribosomal-protein-alanine N-acetyltransferase
MNEKQEYISFKQLETNRLIIREFNISDASDYFSFASNEKVLKYLSSNALKSLDEAHTLIIKTRLEYMQGLIFKLAIVLKESNKVIGYIGLSKYDLSIYTCQIVYAIHEDYWSKGYVSEAVKEFVAYLKAVGKTLIIAGHVKENEASGKVLLKNGFKRDPSRDTQMIINNELKSIINYSIDERKRL